MADSRIVGTAAYHRKDVRVEDTVIIVSIEDDTYQTLDWSLGGFRISGYNGSIGSNSDFLVNGIGPDLDTIFTVRADCKAIRVANGQLSASFVEINSDVYDVLEALMLRRQRAIDRLKQRLPHISLANRFRELAEESIERIYEAYGKLEAATDGGQGDFSTIYQLVDKLKTRAKKFDYGLLTAIGDELCRLVGKLDKPGPKEIQALKVHIDAMKLVVGQNIKGTGGALGEEILTGLRQVSEKLHL